MRWLLTSMSGRSKCKYNFGFEVFGAIVLCDICVSVTAQQPTKQSRESDT